MRIFKPPLIVLVVVLCSMRVRSQSASENETSFQIEVSGFLAGKNLGQGQLGFSSIDLTGKLLNEQMLDNADLRPYFGPGLKLGASYFTDFGMFFNISAMGFYALQDEESTENVIIEQFSDTTYEFRSPGTSLRSFGLTPKIGYAFSLSGQRSILLSFGLQLERINLITHMGRKYRYSEGSIYKRVETEQYISSTAWLTAPQAGIAYRKFSDEHWGFKLFGTYTWANFSFSESATTSYLIDGNESLEQAPHPIRNIEYTDNEASGSAQENGVQQPSTERPFAGINIGVGVIYRL